MKKNFVSITCFLGCLLFFHLVQAQSGLELPAISTNDQVIKHTGYTLAYNETYEQASWVAYELTDAETQKAYERTNKFLPDPAVKTGSATDADYARSGYDRGHLAPAADMGWSETTMKESFYFSNMSPQVPAFNRGIWKKLEEQVRSWAHAYQTLYIATGPVLEGDMPTIGPEKVAVPPAYYKVILIKKGKDYQAIGFILPNEASSLSLQHYAVSVDIVEKRTHLNFFEKLEDQTEETTENSLCLSCWDWGKIQSAQSSPPKEKTVASPSKSSSSSVQCNGVTKKGARCKKMTKDPSGYCNLHKQL